MISETIELLQKQPFYGAGCYTEIAKGKNQIVQRWAQFKEKIIRKRLSKR